MPGYERPDYWTLRAKKEGYPARSVYKLEEIVRKFGLLKGLGGGRGVPDRGPAILDVGAAPGSWSLWLLRQMKGAGRLLAVDIQDLGIAPDDANFSFVKGSILDEEVRASLRAAGPYDLVVSDAAPATSGNRIVDQSRSEELVEAVMGLALEVLAPGGALVVKIFQGGEEKRLLSELRAHFAQARAFKPEACRSESFETYLVATGFVPIR
jgi:23S rRNA (uridine2552-2'-O)-methyltransferase